MTRNENYDRNDDVTFLLALANRYTSEGQERGLPRGLLVMIAEGDGTFTNHFADPDNEMDWFSMVGTMEACKHKIFMENVEFAATDRDGILLGPEDDTDEDDFDGDDE
jgi:hypothetical protein